MTTFEILQSLQSEVGSRRAGTSDERRAQEWLVAKCKALGLPVTLDPFCFLNSSRFRPAVALLHAIWSGASLGLALVGQPFLGSLGVLLAIIYYGSLNKKIEMQLAQTQSHNIIAGLQRPFAEYVADSDKRTAVLVCAHYDTPPNVPVWYKALTNLEPYLTPLGLLGVLIYLVFAATLGLSWLIQLLGAGAMYAFLFTLAPTIGGVALLLAAPQLIRIIISCVCKLVQKETDSPGADDNGSGTALVLALAHRLKKSPPNLDVFFAWWGAEERGLFGSRQFVSRFYKQLDPDRLHIINVDGVGVGECLSIHTGQGVIFRRKTTPETVKRMERIAARLGIKTIHRWESILTEGSSDHAEWVDRGFRHAGRDSRQTGQEVLWPAAR